MIKELLKRPIAYNPIIAKTFGSVKLGILWSQMYYWSERTNDKDGWIYKTQNEVFEETGLSRKEQETARKIGKKLGVLESKVMGVPPKVNFRVDIDKTIELIDIYINGESKELKGAIKELSNPKKVGKHHAGIGITPGVFNRTFFEDAKIILDEGVIENEKESSVIDIRLWAEKKQIKISKQDITEFVLYWTEPNKSGKKERWETEKTFDVKRRLLKWLDNKAKWSKPTVGKKNVSI